MTGKEFMNKLAHAKDDFLQEFLDILKEAKVPFCVIGGLGVNAYAEPVVSLDLDVVLALDGVDVIRPKLESRYKVEEFTHSLNVSEKTSDLRIQIQTDSRYQPFVRRAVKKTVLGYTMPVALIEDVLQGKIWAASDKTRRQSKRQKDLADIARLVETDAKLAPRLPPEIKKQLEF